MSPSSPLLRTFCWASLIAALLGPFAALADTNIVVDGVDTDWPPTLPSCYTEGSGDASNNKLDLVRACLDNNNGSGDLGRLFGLFVTGSSSPPSIDSQYAVSIDTNRDGQISGSDEIWAAFFPAHEDVPTELRVYAASNTSTPIRTYSSTASCGGSATSNGWSALRNGRTVELGIAYGCLGLTFGDDARLMVVSTFPGVDVTPISYYNGTSGTLADQTAPVSNVGTLTALAGSGLVKLTWNNPADVQGVMVLRAVGAKPDTTPTNGALLSVGQVLGNAQVVLFQSGGMTDSFTDTGLSNGQRYFYKVYKQRALAYASGNIPNSNGIFAEPTNGTSPSPLWCYSTGFTSGVQPVADLGVGAFSGNNAGTVTANLSSGTASPDGAERWRPTALNGAIQSRFPVVALGGAGKYIVTGDQSGRAYAINALTGAITWTANGGAPLATRIQAQPSVQLNAFGNAAYKAANPSRDLAFFATAELGSPATTNKVFTLDAATGAVIRTYAPGDLDYISGGMILDYTNNRLWFGTHGGSGSSSVRVISTIATTIDGVSQDKRLSLGAVDTTLSRSADGTQAYIVDNNGLLYAYDLNTMTEIWRKQLSPLSGAVFSVGGGFLVSRGQAGLVERYSVSGTTVTLVWSTPIPWPSGVNLHYGAQKVFVGDLNGTLHQLDVSTGADEKQLAISPGARLFPPSIDEGQGRLHLGTMDGRLCAVTVPIP